MKRIPVTKWTSFLAYNNNRREFRLLLSLKAGYPSHARKQIFKLYGDDPERLQMWLDMLKNAEALFQDWNQPVQCTADDWYELPNGGHVRKVHRDPAAFALP